MTKISIISMNLATNCTNRCLLLADALAPKYNVELAGTSFGPGGRGLWAPIKDAGLPIKAVTGDLLPGYLPQIRDLLRLLDGDLIIACKPRFPSFGVSLIKRALRGTPVILDIDDDELVMTEPGRQASLVHKLRSTNGFLFTRALHPLHRMANGVFCVSEVFRKTYGGIIVPHGRDPTVFDPAKFDRQALRRQLGFPDDAIVIGFIGTPHPQKGTDLIATAAARTGDPRIRVMIAGATAGDSHTEELRRCFGERVLLLPPFPASKVPDYLAAVDVVVLPQRNVPASYGQMPAKLTDAMAMGKIIIASSISDIPRYLEGCGLLVPPDDEAAITQKLIWVANNRAAAEELGRKARMRFLRDMTTAAMREAMVPMIERILRRQR